MNDDSEEVPTLSSRRVVVPEFLSQPHLEKLGTVVEVVYDPDLHAERRLLLIEVGKAHAIVIRNRTRIDEELLSVAGKLMVVARLGVGLDNIDLEACRAAGVRVIPASGANAVSVAEYVIGSMLHLYRGVFSMTPSMIGGDWPRQGHAFGRELLGKTLGLVGFGAIAREVANRATAFGMSIVAHDPLLAKDDPAWSAAEPVELADLLETADVISVHVPLTSRTEGLLDESAIARMKPDAVLINTSRGGIVDEIAVAAALRSGRLGGAALDVFATEPLGPAAGAVFAGLGNLLLTPHVAGNTVESVERVARVTIHSVLLALGLITD